jgi:hypothetical protein
VEDGTQLGQICQILFLWNTKSLGGSSEFTKEIDYNIRFKKNIGKQMLKTNYILNLGQLL